MEFSQYSITHFCNIIYGLSDVPYYTQEFSSIEMYEFLKEKSNNFDHIAFEYLIHDIRNYSEKIQFKISNPFQKPELVIDKETGYPTTQSQELCDAYKPYIIGPLDSFYLYIEFDVDLKFSIEQSIKERIELFKNALPGATILHNISNLIKFSEMAEKEFKKSQYQEIPKVNNSRIESFSTTRLPAANSILKDINKDNFIDLILEIGKLMPDLEVRRVFLEKRFIEMGYSIESGYKQTTYFYNELKKARDGQESIYKGKCINNEDTFALVDSYTCYFKINHIRFNNLEILLNAPMGGSISNTNEQQKTTSKIKTISNPELTLAHIALICYYQNIIINTSNAESILKEFNNPSTPKKIIEKYNYFIQKNNRVCCDETKEIKQNTKDI